MCCIQVLHVWVFFDGKQQHRSGKGKVFDDGFDVSLLHLSEMLLS